jgi:hypothetical protein
MSEQDIVAAIKARVDPARFDFSRAEGRRDFDNALRAELRKIADSSLRAHAGEMLKAWRAELFGLPSQPWSHPALLARVEAIEAYLGLQPRPSQREITTLKPKVGSQL